MSSCIVCGAEGTRCHGSSCNAHADIAVWTEAHAEGYRVAQDAAEIYIVGGSAGSYDSAQEWQICACWSMAEASAMADQIARAVVEYGTHKITSYDRDREEIKHHFVEVLGFPQGTIPYGDLDDIRFFAYSVPLLKRKEEA